jgi:hypothetical protein
MMWKNCQNVNNRIGPCVTEKPEAIASARRCRSSWIVDTKIDWIKWKSEEEERHKGSLPPPQKKEKKMSTKQSRSQFMYATYV